MNQRLIFRVVAFVLAGYFAFRTIVMGAYFLDEGRWGGSLMFLSNWNLLINFIMASCALYKEYKPKFNFHNLLLPASMGINIIVVILYWVLRAMGAFGDGTEDGWDVFDHLRNLYVHLGTTIILFIEAIFFNKIFGNLKQEYGGYMVIFISYIIWMEAFVAPNNEEPCGSVSCGFPYLFINDLSVTGRTIFYFGVWMLGNFAWAFSYYLYQYKERNWNTIE